VIFASIDMAVSGSGLGARAAGRARRPVEDCRPRRGGFKEISR
jgi:hypothetical protein